MSKSSFDLKNSASELVANLQKIRRYSPIIFLILVAALYGFVLHQISSLSSTQPSDDAISSQVQAAQIPHIDKGVAQQLQNLQDNSVNVRSLFNQVRSDPFQE